DQEDGLRAIGVDPEAVVVVAAGRAAEAGEGLATVGGLPGGDVGHVDHVRVLRIGLDLVEVAGPARQPRVLVDPPPALAAVVRAVDGALPRGADDRVEALRVARAGGQADATESFRVGGQALGDGPPGGSTVGGLVEPAAGPAEHAVLP